MIFRKLCISLPKSNYKSFLSNQTFPFNLRPNPQIFRFQKALKSISPCSISHTRQFHFSDSPIGDASRPDAVPIPSPDFADRSELYRALEDSLGSPFSSKPFIPNPHPLIIVISGPSGAGKNAVINRLRQVRDDNIHFVVTATCRGKRAGEIDGKDYFFMSKEEFLGMMVRNELLEYALVYGDYKGVPKQQIREHMSKGCDIVLLRVDIQGAATLRKIIGKSAIFVFLVAESEEALVKRLINRRTESKETLLVRTATAKEEIRHIRDFDYVVVNKEGELDCAVFLVESIIDAEKAKVNQRNVVI